MSWLLFIAGLFIALLLMGCFNLKEKKPPKVNIYGVKYKTEDFASTSKTVAFYDDNKREWVWVEELDAFYFIPEYKPSIRREFFNFKNNELLNMLNSVTSIEVVYKRNREVREGYARALERHNNYINKVKEFRSKY